MSTSIGDAPVTLEVLVSTPDVPLYEELGSAFQAEHPHVTVEVTGEDFNNLTTNVPRLISGTDVPDLVRLASFGNLVKDHLLTDLDPYAEAYGWTEWPQSQFASTRVADDGRQRGTGHLYGAGPGFGLTGVYYNKELAAQIGMTDPPATLGDFERSLEEAKSAGLLPIMVNGKDGGLAYPLQNLQMNYAGSTQVVQDWNYNEPGADIDTSALVEAATTLQRWGAEGYLPEDVNSIDQTQAPARFAEGEGVFFPSGNWQAPALQETGHGEIGFFLFPPEEAGDPFTAMTAAGVLAIPAKSSQPDVAAAFLNFVQTDAGARQSTLDLLGLPPAGPADAPMPDAEPGSLVAATVESFQTLLESDGLVDFMSNSTASMHANTLIPQTQLLVAGKTSPSEFSAALQEDYENDTE
ncbi:ABC transporter substrate-binding protein [Myceligenerans pegani]|uniref:Extracellular solute-binding protein n=1 Tax=Myceligenerans pegani TaxID=2776917 RepID=A0ABR9N3S3_9MICO|nr:extracellular solute-binding protein [Myceligenerans sp. TRM 65318]MBE1878313.1 extracellular solute-binding protein [Myceligenerans sp. TRM 65318]MBE3020584.1 extracellular solute-binding protein [Myceligenerans sp. TRM 65318]